jgi:dTMP kinase
MNRGKYIVLEGTQGTGKTSQIIELSRRLRAAGLPVRIFREPDSQSDLAARAIRQITQDPRYEINTRTEVLLYNAARAQSLQVIRQCLEQGINCVVDRNYLTTLAIQYYARGDVPDYNTITQIISFAVGDMEPDLTIILDAPIVTLKARLRDRYSAERFDNLDDEFMEKIRAGYLLEAKKRNLPVVYVNKGIEDVANEIWSYAAKTLAERTPRKMQGSVTSETSHISQILEQKRAPLAEPPLTMNPPTPPDKEGPAENTAAAAASTKKDTVSAKAPNSYVTKQDGQYAVTEAGEKYLQEVVTTTKGNVYAFTDKLSPITIAAAMARLSRRAGDMRVTILDEFAHQLGKDEKLLQRVITGYGDDSVQQLTGLHVVVEGASQILTKRLEWGRLAAYLEQSTRYIYYDQKDAQGNYGYYTPDHLDNAAKQQYRTIMDQIFDLYSGMVHRLTEYVAANDSTPQAERDIAWKSAVRAQACDAARPVLPVATKSTVGIFASGQALESLIMHLQSDELPEAHQTGDELLTQARKIIPAFLERADRPDRGGAMIAYRSNTRKAVQKLAREYLPDSYANGNTEPVQLTSVWPRNELDLIPDMLYEHTSMPLGELQQEVAAWPYDKKIRVFEAYIGERLNRRHKPGRALEKAHYSWDLVCDYGSFRDLQRHRMVDDLEWQQLTPRYGYDVPQLVEDAGLTEQFEQCFDLSLKLYSLLQEAGYALEAQYATLLGHKMRWKVTYNAREAFHLHELRTSSQGHPGYRKLVQQMHEKLSDKHPLLGEAMRFVNQDEDPELTRLAAERYTQFKLNQLDNKA